ncbi:hypothetical protein EDB81DRAFT_698486 [Dactylonectria macrodidyma]|uniref:Alpha-ketoglutarate-dependent sulfonate dioxygenase n=1 Tax=Dactylonectria macrodidyma TaxID=307937 RepID=A0A9P9DX05_9HYPO|nr:hypothetical protein EDB81DRAFT_698486 [Dactylonectria macrodidyma]
MSSSRSSSDSLRQAPPAYDDDENEVIDEQQETELNEAFYALELSPSPTAPTVDTCLAHLKLLSAFEELKIKVGNTNGLWEIWDSRSINPSGGASVDPAEILVKLREKRWAVYVARAVDRYEAWWASFVPGMLRLASMMTTAEAGDDTYEGFPSQSKPINWTSETLPPLDVLLVWHAHMLNPRNYLEDCLRHGYGSLWAAGMPWALLNEAINPQFEYSGSDVCQDAWKVRTGRDWVNQADPVTKQLKCPACSMINEIPWTTCGQGEDAKGGRPGLVGTGYGDGKFTWVCNACGMFIDHEILRFAKFRNDVTNLVKNDFPMPGTIINAELGLVKKTPKDSDQLFPNRLVRLGLLVEVLEGMKPGSAEKPTMAKIRDTIEEITRQTHLRHSTKQLKKIDKGISGLATLGSHQLSISARLHTRRMMSRYWENSSIFSIDLCGCVMRQGVFTNKMYKIDWIHTSTAGETMLKLLSKYDRFFDIIATHPNKVVVPTLDIDLAWHTHQLSPQNYFNFTVSKTLAFTDHNDKVDEDQLAISFGWMSKIYQDTYGEVYAQCTCWFCESIRTMNTTGSKSAKGKLNSDAVETVQQETPREPVHISSHPAMQVGKETTSRRRTQKLLFHNELNDSYDKARRQYKKGFRSLFGQSSRLGPSSAARTIGPRGEDSCNHWGKTILLQGPWASQMVTALTPEMYATPPGVFHTQSEKPGACAAGTCGGQGRCGSGAVSVCGAGCTGMGKDMGSSFGAT